MFITGQQVGIPPMIRIRSLIHTTAAFSSQWGVRPTTADDFVDDEPYDDGFARLPTIAAVLKKAEIVDIPKGLKVLDGF